MIVELSAFINRNLSWHNYLWRKPIAFCQHSVPSWTEKTSKIKVDDKKMNNFDWSLQPLTLCLKFLGIPLNFTKKGTSPNIVAILVSIFGFCIIGANFFNGQRGIEIDQLEFMKKVHEFDSPFLYFKKNMYGLIKLVKLISEMIFFCYIPFIHFVFILTVLFDPNWKKLIGLLKKIQRKMKLDAEFHRKCRRHCFAALIFLSVVSKNYTT